MARVFGALAALVLLTLLAVSIDRAMVSSDLVVPTNGVIGRDTVDDPAPGGATSEALRRRTEMQRWRVESGPSPDRPAPPAAEVGTGPAVPAGTGDADPQGFSLVRAWLADPPTDMLRAPAYVEGRSSLPGPVVDVFEQPQGRLWRSVHNGQIVFGGAFYIFGLSALLALFLALRGRIPVKEGFSGETVRRFDAVERANHWMTAGSFLLMALTGVIVLYGGTLIRPWLGPDRFGDLAEAGVWLHMALALPFVLGLAVMIVLWTGQNLPRRVDWTWIRRGGGLLSDSGPTPPAERFNAGQKLIFWSVVLGGLVLVGSGVTLMLPFLWAGYDGMLIAQGVHAVAGLAMIGVIIGHIYIGTVGMQGAFDAMWSGWVDRNWAEEHHSLWLERVRARHSGPAPRDRAE